MKELFKKSLASLSMIAMLTQFLAPLGYSRNFNQQRQQKDISREEFNKKIDAWTKLIGEIKKMNTAHQRMNEDELRNDYWHRLNRSASLIRVKLDKTSIEAPDYKKRASFLERIEDTRDSLMRKSKEAILKREKKEIAYLEQRLQENLKEFNDVSPSINPIRLLGAMVGILFCCTGVGIIIGLPLIEASWSGTNDSDWDF